MAAKHSRFQLGELDAFDGDCLANHATPLPQHAQEARELAARDPDAAFELFVFTCDIRGERSIEVSDRVGNDARNDEHDQPDGNRHELRQWAAIVGRAELEKIGGGGRIVDQESQSEIPRQKQQVD